MFQYCYDRYPSIEIFHCTTKNCIELDCFCGSKEKTNKTETKISELNGTLSIQNLNDDNGKIGFDPDQFQNQITAKRLCQNCMEAQNDDKEMVCWFNKSITDEYSTFCSCISDNLKKNTYMFKSTDVWTKLIYPNSQSDEIYQFEAMNTSKQSPNVSSENFLICPSICSTNSSYLSIFIPIIIALILIIFLFIYFHIRNYRFQHLDVPERSEKTITYRKTEDN